MQVLRFALKQERLKDNQEINNMSFAPLFMTLIAPSGLALVILAENVAVSLMVMRFFLLSQTLERVLKTNYVDWVRQQCTREWGRWLGLTVCAVLINVVIMWYLPESFWQTTALRVVAMHAQVFFLTSIILRSGFVGRWLLSRRQREEG